jgi:hypothetical protein
MDETVGRNASPIGTDGSLSRLLQTEAVLAERLAAAEQEAVRIRAAAREMAREADDGLAREIDVAVQALERAYAERRIDRLRQVEVEKARRVEALGALPPQEVERMAADVVERLLATAEGTAT